MGKLIDGLAIAKKINLNTAKRVARLKKKGIFPKLAVVLVGNDPASLVYVRQKEHIARLVGVDFILHVLPADVIGEKLTRELQKIQTDTNLSGLIMQLPVPEKLYVPAVLNAIDKDVDVDFLSESSMGQILLGTNKMEPPTPGSILTIMRSLKIKLSGKDITIVGMGTLVGKPLSMLLEHEGASITTCNHRTRDIPDKCRRADVVVSCVGKKDLIRGNMIKPGAVVIDAGFSFHKGKSYGDINLSEVQAVASHVTPTPGGVGPITVSLLLQNTVKCAEQKLDK